MAISYKDKVIISGKTVETFKYETPIYRGFRSRKQSLKTVNIEINVEDIFKADSNRKVRFASSANRAKTKLRRLIDANSNLNKFVTLTFSENLTDLKVANARFNLFVKRISYQYPSFQYIAVPEFQARGAVHYHLLADMPYIPVKRFEDEIWGHGFVKINAIEDVDRVGAYVSKYVSKDFSEQMFNQKRYFCSRSLLKPVEYLGYLANLVFNKMKQFLVLQFSSAFNSDWLGVIHYCSFLDFRYNNCADIEIAGWECG